MADSERLCGHCGATLVRTRAACEVCNAEGQSLEARPPERQRLWLQVRAQFDCRVCGLASPLNHLDADGKFHCLRCQHDQAADPEIWRDALQFCHAVADLSGPNPEGRLPDAQLSIASENKWADIGVARASAPFELGETVVDGGRVDVRSLRVDASPGHPLCTRCHALLDVKTAARGSIETHCPSCNESATYSVPDGARNLHGALVGVIADDLRADREAAKLDESGSAAVAILCPRCGAALSPSAQDHFVTCRYCQHPSKIPSRLRSQLFEDGIAVERWWLLFEGVSARRAELLERARKEAEEDERGRRARADAIVSHVYAAVRAQYGDDALATIKEDRAAKGRIHEAAARADRELDQHDTALLEATTGAGAVRLTVTRAMRRAFDGSAAKREKPARSSPPKVDSVNLRPIAIVVLVVIALFVVVAALHK